MTAQEPPYPADTRAKGWRFELEYERIDQSDTWSFAAEVPMAQHCLLMMWLVAWKETPCGSLPNDEAAIRAKCRIPPAMWSKVCNVLMRGWSPATDGRLYHATITARVLEMVESRSKNAKRVAEWKAAQREQQVGNALPTHKQQSKNDTGTGTSSSPTSKKKAPPCVGVSTLVAAGFSESVAAEFIAHKARLKAPLTERAWAAHLREAAAAGWTPLNAAIKVMERAWKAFEAQYVAKEPRAVQPSGESAWQRAQRERVEAMTGGLVSAKPPTAHQTEIVDV